MLMVIKKTLHTLTVRKILHNAHIINKSHIVHRQTHFLMRLHCFLLAMAGILW